MHSLMCLLRALYDDDDYDVGGGDDGGGGDDDVGYGENDGCSVYNAK